MSFIKPIIQSSGVIPLSKFCGEFRIASEPDLFSGQGKNICFLDVETTGKNRQDDGIVEIAVKSVSINAQSGEIISINNQYESFNDPGIPISKEASAVNGITDEIISGKHIDWDIVEEIFASTELLVSHNASFDRAFLDRALPESKKKLWACSINDIDWMSRGFKNVKQELLCIWHGYYYDSHRAMNDVDALIHLLTHDVYSDNKPVLELIENSTTPYYKISALGSPFATKDRLKARNYLWDRKNKYWWTKVVFTEVESEKDWLSKNVYSGYFQGRVEEITTIDKYKD